MPFILSQFAKPRGPFRVSFVDTCSSIDATSEQTGQHPEILSGGDFEMGQVPLPPSAVSLFLRHRILFALS